MCAVMRALHVMPTDTVLRAALTVALATIVPQLLAPLVSSGEGIAAILLHVRRPFLSAAMQCMLAMLAVPSMMHYVLVTRWADRLTKQAKALSS